MIHLAQILNHNHHPGDEKYIPPSMTIDASIQLWQKIEDELLQGNTNTMMNSPDDQVSFEDV